MLSIIEFLDNREVKKFSKVHLHYTMHGVPQQGFYTSLLCLISPLLKSFHIFIINEINIEMEAEGFFFFLNWNLIQNSIIKVIPHLASKTSTPNIYFPSNDWKKLKCWKPFAQLQWDCTKLTMVNFNFE